MIKRGSRNPPSFSVTLGVCVRCYRFKKNNARKPAHQDVVAVSVNDGNHGRGFASGLLDSFTMCLQGGNGVDIEYFRVLSHTRKCVS